MELDEDQRVTWWLAFGPAPRLAAKREPAAWVIRRLPAQFQHVCAWRWSSPAGAWLVLDVLSDGIRVSSVAPAALRAAGHAGMEGWLRSRGYLSIEVPPRDVRPSLFRGPLTCVTAMKHLTGVAAWWIVTPRQLWRFLTEEDGHGRTDGRGAEGQFEADRGAEPQGGGGRGEGGPGAAEDDRGAAARAGGPERRGALAADLRRRFGRAAAAVTGTRGED